MSNVHYLNKPPSHEQLDLFGYQRPYHKYGWLDISSLNQSRFLRCAEVFEATHILDTRKLPVFRRPKFHYNDLFSFFELHKVSYFSSTDDNQQHIIEETFLQLKRASVVRDRLNIILIFESVEDDNHTFEYRALLESIDDTYETFLSA